MSLSEFDDRPDAIRFMFVADKALSILHMLALQYAGIGITTVLTACYFAEKAHLNLCGRPIFGASYRAMPSGPVPVEIYQMLKSEPYWLAETAKDRFPWETRGTNLFPVVFENPDLMCLSKSDVAAIDAAVDKARRLKLDRRTADTHGPDWQNARLGWIAYEDMFDEGPDKAARIDDIRYTARFSVL